MTAFVVDDNAFMIRLIKQVLRGFGLTDARGFTDPVEALDALQSVRPDFIILDWIMEPIDGRDFTRLVRRGTDIADNTIPIIMLIGHTENHLVTEARNAGVTEFVMKPVSATNIYLRIEELIVRPRDFIIARHYVGPDRRRKDEEYGGVERRGNDGDAMAEAAARPSRRAVGR